MRRTEIGADWLTVTTNPAEVYQTGVTRYIDAFYQVDWSDRAESLLDEIADKLQLGKKYIAVGGDNTDSEIRTMPKLSKKGYKAERQYKNIVMGYHPLYEYMGVCIELSGDALRDYRKMMAPKGVELVEAYILRSVADIAESFQSAQHGIKFSSKCTRIDIAIDEFDGQYTVTDFIINYYHMNSVITSEQENKYGEVIEKPMNVGKQIIQTTAGGESLYVGSISSSKRLNIYNKVAERENAGEQQEETNWVRFEGRFKKEYALQIGNNLMAVADADAFNGLKYYYAVMVSNYGFKQPDGSDHPLVTEWRERSKGTLGVLQSEDRRKSSFATSYEHIAERSGLFSLMKKAELLHGVEAVDALVKALLLDYEKYKATDDVNKCVYDHGGEDWEETFPSGWKHQMEEILSEQSDKKRGS